MGTHIYSNLQAIRLLKGISIETVATKVNFSFGHYRRIEHGKTDIKVSKLLEIIKALNTKPDLVFGHALFVPLSNIED